MTARSFQQTQAAASLGTIQACAASVVSSVPQARLCVEGGVAGVTPLSVTVRNQRASIMFEMAPGQAGWSAGNWGVPVFVQTLNANVTIVACYVCRRTAAGAAVGTVGSVTGLSISCGTTGVKTIPPISGALSVGSATDVAYIVVECTTPGTNQVFAITPNQIITTPILSALTSTAAGTLAGMTGAAVGLAVSPIVTAAAGSLSGLTGAASASAVHRLIGSGAFAGLTGEASGAASAMPRGTVLHPNTARVFVLT